MNLFLNVKRRGMDNQIRPILFVLAAPHQLRVQIAIPAFDMPRESDSAHRPASRIGIQR